MSLFNFRKIVIEKERKKMAADTLTQCPVCLTEYDLEQRVPRILPCHHSSCHECITVLLQQTDDDSDVDTDDDDTDDDEEEDDGINKLKCPVCRAEHEIKEAGALTFAQNQYIVACLERKKNENGFSRCYLHNREQTLYCRDGGCHKIICSKCYLVDHKKHVVVDVDDEVKEKVAIVKEAETTVENGKAKLCRAQDIMIKALNTTLEEIDNKREELKAMIDGKLNEYTKECMERHEQNMKMIEAKKTFIDGRLKVLEGMKSHWSILGEKIFQLQKVNQIKESADFFSQLDGFTGLSYYAHSAFKNKWEFGQICGELLNYKWNFQSENPETDGQISPLHGKIIVLFSSIPSCLIDCLPL